MKDFKELVEEFKEYTNYFNIHPRVIDYETELFLKGKRRNNREAKHKHKCIAANKRHKKNKNKKTHR